MQLDGVGVSYRTCPHFRGLHPTDAMQVVTKEFKLEHRACLITKCIMILPAGGTKTTLYFPGFIPTIPLAFPLKKVFVTTATSLYYLCTKTILLITSSD